ncbi:MAG: hypothetical protein Q9162_001745 [Coniocarpon cinnabarinum]
MNQQNDPSWAQAGDPNAMGLDMNDLADDEFSSFLNPEFIGPDFANLDDFDDSNAPTQPPFGASLVQPNGQNDFGQSAQLYATHSRPTTSGVSGTSHDFGPSHLAQVPQYAHGGFLPQNPIDGLDNAMPGALPTPNSSEMYAKNYEFFQQQQEARHRQQQQQQQHFTRLSGDLSTFTPYESPAMDGMQSAVSYASEYNLAPFSLSPIPSPAMNPQTQSGQTPRSTPRTAGSSAMNSPRSDQLDADGGLSVQEDSRPRKRGKKTAPASKSAGPRTRKAAANNAKRRDSLSVRIPPGGGSAGPSSAKSLKGKNVIDVRGPTSAPQSNGSGSSSISPRPSSEAIMAPPPKPSTSMTALLPSTPKGADQATNLASPATPASMMKDKTSGRGTGSGSVNSGEALSDLQHSMSTSVLESNMESLILPEPAAPSPDSNGLDDVRNEDHATPAKRRSQVVDSNTASESPQIMSTTASPAGPRGMQKEEIKGRRNSKKRNSSGSNLVSPALRPKVSPSVKPLLPEGTNMDPQTQALLLATRSNYENIVSGNHLPGVSYPDGLGATLTMKRTSHKLAEQGRRNRINDALKEMQTLLPPTFATKGKDSEGASNANIQKNAAAAIQSSNSKAATVENAIEYIKALQQEMQAKEGLIKKLHEENTGLKSQSKT